MEATGVAKKHASPEMAELPCVSFKRAKSMLRLVGGDVRTLFDHVAVIEDKHNWQETLAKVSKGIWTRTKLPRLEKDFPRCSQDSVRPGEVQVK